MKKVLQLSLLILSVISVFALKPMRLSAPQLTLASYKAKLVNGLKEVFDGLRAKQKTKDVSEIKDIFVGFSDMIVNEVISSFDDKELLAQLNAQDRNKQDFEDIFKSLEELIRGSLDAVDVGIDYYQIAEELKSQDYKEMKNILTNFSNAMVICLNGYSLLRSKVRELPKGSDIFDLKVRASKQSEIIKKLPESIFKKTETITPKAGANLLFFPSYVMPAEPAVEPAVLKQTRSKVNILQGIHMDLTSSRKLASSTIVGLLKNISTTMQDINQSDISGTAMLAYLKQFKQTDVAYINAKKIFQNGMRALLENLEAGIARYKIATSGHEDIKSSILGTTTPISTFRAKCAGLAQELQDEAWLLELSQVEAKYKKLLDAISALKSSVL